MRGAGLEPLEPYPGGHHPWKCRCLRCGEAVEPRFANVFHKGTGCDFCGRRSGAAARRVPQDEAIAVMRAAGLEPLEPYVSSNTPWKCRCVECSEEHEPRYQNIRAGWGGCRTCRYRKQAAAQRGPEDKAIAIMLAAGLQPLVPYRSNHEPWRCKCLVCGEEPSPTLKNISSGKSAGCAFCAGRAVIPEDAVAVMRTAGLEPLVPYPGSGLPWPCRCIRCEWPVSPSYSSVKSGGQCKRCSAGTPTSDEAVAFIRSRRLQPLEPFKNATAQWRCQCMKCGKIVNPVYADVRRNPGGCKWCRDRGFKAYEAAVVYLIIHEGYDAVKIGIAGKTSARISKHRQHGWQIVTIVDVPGEAALIIEDDILEWWRVDLRLPIHLGRLEMPQGGWTETAAASEVDLAATISQMRLGARAVA
jgi:hypothetical protein